MRGECGDAFCLTLCVVDHIPLVGIGALHSKVQDHTAAFRTGDGTHLQNLCLNRSRINLGSHSDQLVETVDFNRNRICSVRGKTAENCFAVNDGGSYLLTVGIGAYDSQLGFINVSGQLYIEHIFRTIHNQRVNRLEIVLSIEEVATYTQCKQQDNNDCPNKSGAFFLRNIGKFLFRDIFFKFLIIIVSGGSFGRILTNFLSLINWVFCRDRIRYLDFDWLRSNHRLGNLVCSECIDLIKHLGELVSDTFVIIT